MNRPVQSELQGFQATASGCGQEAAGEDNYGPISLDIGVVDGSAAGNCSRKVPVEMVSAGLSHSTPM
jgi:hypothetical protein